MVQQFCLRSSSFKWIVIVGRGPYSEGKAWIDIILENWQKTIEIRQRPPALNPIVSLNSRQQDGVLRVTWLAKARYRYALPVFPSFVKLNDCSTPSVVETRLARSNAPLWWRICHLFWMVAKTARSRGSYFPM